MILFSFLFQVVANTSEDMLVSLMGQISSLIAWVIIGLIGSTILGMFFGIIRGTETEAEDVDDEDDEDGEEEDWSEEDDDVEEDADEEEVKLSVGWTSKDETPKLNPKENLGILKENQGYFTEEEKELLKLR